MQKNNTYIIRTKKLYKKDFQLKYVFSYVSPKPRKFFNVEALSK